MNLNRRGGRVVEGARLESVYTSNRIKGSNPFLSAIFKQFCKVQIYIEVELVVVWSSVI